MKLFHQPYKDRKGKTRQSANWYFDLTDHRGIVRRFPGFTDKGATDELRRRIQKLIECRVAGASLDAEMAKWMETVPTTLRNRLLKYGLIDSQSVASAKPLLCRICKSSGCQPESGEPCACNGEHLSVFRASLLHKGTSIEHADLITARVRNILEGCGFTHYGEISASRVMEYLADLRKVTPANGDTPAKPGISVQTSNFYLQSVKQFGRFMVKDGRARENPVAHLDGLNVKIDRRHDRRNLTVTELTNLLTTTLAGPVRHKLTGRRRVMLYRVAMETGLRRKELRTLTPGSFDFEVTTPTVYVEAGRSKNGKTTVLPIRPEMAKELREWFRAAGIGPADALWPDLTNHTAKMLKADLEATGIAYVDDAGLFADFHALRHSFISMLAAGNVHPKLAQRLARHSDINLTMMRYSHTLLADEATALDALPHFPSAFDKPTTLQATGTDGRAVESVLQDGLQEQAAQTGISIHRVAPSRGVKGATTEQTKTPRNPAIAAESGASSSGEAGIRTLGTLADTPVFKTDSASPYQQVPQEDTEINPTVLQDCLQESVEIDPECQRVASAWPTLPDHIRRAILALADIAGKRAD